MKRWHWIAISVVAESVAGVAMLMSYREEAKRRTTGDAWDKALADVTKPKPSEFSSQNDD
jgi:hypothetical protein